MTTRELQSRDNLKNFFSQRLFVAFVFILVLLLAAAGLIVVGLWNLCMRHSTLQITNFTV